MYVLLTVRLSGRPSEEQPSPGAAEAADVRDGPEAGGRAAARLRGGPAHAHPGRPAPADARRTQEEEAGGAEVS